MEHSQGIFSMHQVPIVVDYCTKYEQNQPILFWYIATNIQFMKNIDIITEIGHRATCYFTHISNTWYLLTVPNMNTTNPFFSEISQQIHKSSLVTCSSYDHLYAMNDKSKTTLVCGVSYHTGALLSFYMRPHKLNLIQLAVPQTWGFFR